MRRKTIAALVLLAVAAATTLFAQEPKVRVQDLPRCTTGAPPFFVYVLNGTDANDCNRSTGGQGVDQHSCWCLNGTYVAIPGAGGSGSIVVEEADGSPSVDPTTTLQFGAGFTVTDEGGDQAQVDLDLEPMPPSFANPPASPGTYDDEFDNDLSAWSWGGTATTPGTGDVNPVANVATTPVYNINDQWPSWLLVQSDDATNETIDLTRSYTATTNETFFVRVAVNIKAFSTTNEGDFYLVLTNSGDANESAFIGVAHTSAGTFWSFGCNNNGTVTSRSGNIETFPMPASGLYLVLYKTSNNYQGFVMGESGTHLQMGAVVAKTGVTTLDRINLRFHTANETPSTFWGVDFVRYYATNTFDLMNASAGPGGGGGGGASLVVEEADGSPSESATDLIQWGDGLVQTDEGTGDVEIDVLLAGDVDGAGNATDLDETAVEAELEAVLDLPDLQGILTVAQGGSGAAPAGDDQVLVSSSASAAAWATVPDSEAAGVILGYDQATNAWSTKTDDDVPEAGDFGALAATAPITQAGGTVSTSIATGRLVGRTTGGTGVMEEITPDATLSLAAGGLGVVDVTCTGCLGTTEVAALDAGDTTAGTFADDRIDGSAEADELVLAGDVDGTANANDLDEAAVEAELEAVLDLQDLAGVLDVASGGTGAAPGADDQVLVSDSTSAATWRTVPDCDNPTTSKLLYDQATNTWSCGDDQGGGGGANVVEVSIPLTSAGAFFSATVTGQAWVTSSSKILCSPFGTSADGLTAETIAVAGLHATAANRVAGTGFDVLVSSPYGLEGTVRFHCTGA